MGSHVSRRRALAVGAVVGTIGVAGCVDRQLGSDDEAESTTEPETDGDGWRTFRGDSRLTGVAPAEAAPGESLAVDWRVDGADVAIERDLEDSITVTVVSSPVVADESIVAIVECVDESTDDPFTTLLAIDLESGEIEWALGIESLEGRVLDPVVDNEVIGLVHWTDDGGRLSVIDPEDGEFRDERPLERPSQPTVADRTLYVDGASVVSSGLSDGGDLSNGNGWETELGTEAEPAARLTVTDDAVLAPRGDGLVSLARDDGARRWDVSFDASSGTDGVPSGVTAPVVGDGAAYCAGDRDALGGVQPSALVAFDPDDGEERWRFRLGSDDDAIGGVYGYPIERDGIVYAVGLETEDPDAESLEDAFSLFAVDDGDLVWQVDAGPTLVPVAADDVLYVPAEEGVSVYGADGERRSEVDLESTPTPYRSPAIADGRLVVPTDDGLVALGD